MELEAAPWCAPREREVAPGVYITNIYAYHVVAALIYAGWKKFKRAALDRHTHQDA